GRLLVFAALEISNDAVVKGVDFELNLSICALHTQRDRYCRRYSTLLEYTAHFSGKTKLAPANGFRSPHSVFAAGEQISQSTFCFSSQQTDFAVRIRFSQPANGFRSPHSAFAAGKQISQSAFDFRSCLGEGSAALLSRLSPVPAFSHGRACPLTINRGSIPQKRERICLQRSFQPSRR